MREIGYVVDVLGLKPCSTEMRAGCGRRVTRQHVHQAQFAVRGFIQVALERSAVERCGSESRFWGKGVVGGEEQPRKVSRGAGVGELEARIAPSSGTVRWC